MLLAETCLQQRGERTLGPETEVGYRVIPYIRVEAKCVVVMRNSSLR